jgi:hypothetical protein
VSEHLKAYLSAYAAWVDAGAPDGEPFDRCIGLCTNILNWEGRPPGLVAGLKAAFKADGLDKRYPFGGEDQYDAAADNNEQHLNEQRLAWVRSKIAQYEVV